jgi:anti-sigma-K factor RskA
MNCPKFETQIALYVGGDLSNKEAKELEQHLSNCQECSQFMVGLQESLLSLTNFGQLNIDEQVFTTLRANVMAEIRKQNQQIGWWQKIFNFSFGSWRYALVSSVILAVLATSTYLLFVNKKEVTNQATVNQTNSSLEKPVVKPDNKLAKSEVINNIEEVRQPVEHKKNRYIKVNRKINKNVVKDIEPTNTSEIALVNDINKSNSGQKFTIDNVALENIMDNKVKMEIQTSNPNIRIIWFVNKEEKVEKRTTS